MNEKSTKLTKPISWLFLLYFLILFGERLQSLIQTIRHDGLFPTTFDAVVNLTAILSLSAALIMLLLFDRSFWRSLFTSAVPDYSALTITSGVMLVSGMVHTEYTVAPIQFVSYGMLIIAMILRAAQLSGSAGSRFALWYSLIYLTAFSMAIPVVYRSAAANAALFHFIEADVMLMLVICFTLMLRRLFIGRGENLLLWVPFIIMVIGDAAVLWMRWPEEINFFVLIFAGLSAALFLLGKLIIKNKPAES